MKRKFPTPKPKCCPECGEPYIKQVVMIDSYGAEVGYMHEYGPCFTDCEDGSYDRVNGLDAYIRTAS